MRDALSRRIEHLTDRIEANPDRNLSFDKSERDAMTKALKLVQRSVIPMEGDALVVRALDDGTAELMLVIDGEVHGEVHARREDGRLVLDLYDDVDEGSQNIAVHRPPPEDWYERVETEEGDAA